MLSTVFQMISDHFSSPDWTDKFRGMNLLRSLNKSFPGETYSIFEGFGEQIMESLCGTKSSLVKNCLAFIYEMLMQSRAIHPQIFQKVLPKVLKMTQHTSKSFKACCSQCISLIYQHHANSTTLTIFAVESVSNFNKPKLSKFCFKSMIKCVHALKNKICELHPDTFQVIFKTISWHLNNFKCKSRASAERLSRYFFDLMGQENFKEYVKTLVDENVISLAEANQFMSVVVSNKKKFSKARFSFKDFKSENQQFIRMNKERNLVQGIPNEFCVPEGTHYF